MNKIRITVGNKLEICQDLEEGSLSILEEIMEEKKINPIEDLTAFIISSDLGTEDAKMDEIEKDTDNMTFLYRFELTPAEEFLISTHAFVYYID